MNTDYAYCLGFNCPIRDNCKRYLPEPPDMALWWVPSAYNGKECPDFESKNK